MTDTDLGKRCSVCAAPIPEIRLELCPDAIRCKPCQDAFDDAEKRYNKEVAFLIEKCAVSPEMEKLYAYVLFRSKQARENPSLDGKEPSISAMPLLVWCAPGGVQFLGYGASAKEFRRQLESLFEQTEDRLLFKVSSLISDAYMRREVQAGQHDG